MGVPRGSGEALRVREGILEEGHRLDRKRVFRIGRKALSLEQGTHPVRNNTLGPTAGWPPTGRPEHSQSDLGFGTRLQAWGLEWSRGWPGLQGGRCPRPGDPL